MRFYRSIRKKVNTMKILRQLLIIFFICAVCTAVSSFIAFPASVLSLAVLLVLLLANVVKKEHIKETSEFLLSNMAFFFIPAGVKIMEEFSKFSSHIIPILIIIFISTVLTFAASAFTVSIMIKFMNKRKNGEN